MGTPEETLAHLSRLAKPELKGGKTAEELHDLMNRLHERIDDAGKKMLGKIIIVDPDDENPEDFLRQTADALKQGGMKCVVIRGYGAYCVGEDLDNAWANAAMLENSMQIVLLARQAKLKV